MRAQQEFSRPSSYYEGVWQLQLRRPFFLCHNKWMSSRDDRVIICRKVSFSSGHRCYRPDLSEEENQEIFGSSYSRSGHGNNFILEACFRGRVDPVTGMVINLSEIDSLLKEVVAPLDHHFLNDDVDHFQDIVPTTENIALYCYHQIKERAVSRLDQVGLHRVRLFEGDDLWVECGGFDS